MVNLVSLGHLISRFDKHCTLKTVAKISKALNIKPNEIIKQLI